MKSMEHNKKLLSGFMRRMDNRDLSFPSRDSLIVRRSHTKVIQFWRLCLKPQSLPANTIQIVTTSVDVHPCENSILILVCGQLKCDEDPILPFCEMFFLRKFGNCFLISDSMFRLSLHNF
ncbi:hypothetical protein MN116_001334 [Schistosoma mekongi]|uniref:NTF2 domain-containing protein n=1 Tax=Schistosoma mekongi TaxID=38744 RepID=A0AAE1ZMB3_SCHME|nr:hypothetical protein MN116_001334 [Schistosoma mekongi]